LQGFRKKLKQEQISAGKKQRSKFKRGKKIKKNALSRLDDVEWI